MLANETPWVIHFDGSCSGTSVGCAIHVTHPSGEVCYAKGVALGLNGTNNTAEYMGIITALDFLQDRPEIKTAIVRGDSKLVIEQVSGRWVCRAPHLQTFLAQAKSQMAALRRAGRDIAIEWVPREQNSHADAIADVAQAEQTHVLYEKKELL